MKLGAVQRKLQDNNPPQMAPRTTCSTDVRAESNNGGPTVTDMQGDNPFAQLAKLHWLKTSKKPAKVKVKPEVIKKEIWDILSQEGFPYISLLILENLRILERQAYKYCLIFPDLC